MFILFDGWVGSKRPSVRRARAEQRTASLLRKPSPSERHVGPPAAFLPMNRGCEFPAWRLLGLGRDSRLTYPQRLLGAPVSFRVALKRMVVDCLLVQDFRAR